MNRRTYQVFFAIPFDQATKSMYERIVDLIHCDHRYKDKLQLIIGSAVVGPSPEYREMAAFKAQNADLIQQFRSQISDSDIVVADLTSNNPNVHLELGIALSLNKNILRVTSRNIVEVASDIKGQFVTPYSSVSALIAQLEGYFDMFLRIKENRLESGNPFYRLHCIERLDHLYDPDSQRDQTAELPYPHQLKSPYPSFEPLVPMRDGKLWVKFALDKSLGPSEAWFGVYFRCKYPSLPWLGGYLVTVRQSGLLDLPEMPLSGRKAMPTKKYDPLRLAAEYDLNLEVDGSHLLVWLDNDPDPSRVDDLQNQTYGLMSVACYACNVRFKTIETVCRDTIDIGEPTAEHATI
jgi:hypothetical protein